MMMKMVEDDDYPTVLRMSSSLSVRRRPQSTLNQSRPGLRVI